MIYLYISLIIISQCVWMFTKNIYRVLGVMGREKLIIETYASGPYQTNAYLVVCNATKSAIVIDPSLGSEKRIQKKIEAEEIDLKAIWLTHSHWDHIADCSAFRKSHGASLPIHVHFLDQDNLIKPGSDGIPSPITISAEKPTSLFREGSFLECGDFQFQVLHTPGHSPGSVCFLDLNSKILFTGDTLFQGTYGNVSFPTSSPKEMVSSLKRLSLLDPDDLIIYPGHGPSSTLAREKVWLIRR